MVKKHLKILIILIIFFFGLNVVNAQEENILESGNEILESNDSNTEELDLDNDVSTNEDMSLTEIYSNASNDIESSTDDISNDEPTRAEDIDENEESDDNESGDNESDDNESGANESDDNESGDETTGPEHEKTIQDNEDGTYTLELTVTGDADTEIQEAGGVNIVLVYDVSQSMTNNAGSSRYSRADQAEDIVHDFLINLAKYQNSAKNNINVSLVNFAVTATEEQGWTTNVTGLANRFDDGGTDGNVLFRYNGYGTNWEAALQRAQLLINSANPANPTFVIFITDGAPTASGNGNNAISPSGARIGDLRDRYNAATDEAYAIVNLISSDGTFYGIYVYGTEADLLDDLMYYSENGQHRGGNINNVVAATEEAPNYFNAGETSELQEAIDKIFDKVVQAMGISSVSISDGTTNNVETSTGDIAELLEVDEDSYEYWISIPVVNNSFTRVDRDGNTVTYTITQNGDNCTVTWTGHSVTVEGKISDGQFKYKWTEANDLYDYDAPEAEFVNGAVNWNLSSVGTLLDKVTYSVTFIVYPSQQTLDYVADIKNNPGEDGAWATLDPEVQKYIDSNGNLKTNTTATLSYEDTRTGETGSSTYDNPDPVETTAVEQIVVTKEWENEIDSRDQPPVTLTVTRDGVDTYEITLSDENDWKDNVFISIGIMKNGIVLSGAEGHDFTFTEPKNLSYHWELDVPIIRPMLIDGELTILIKVDEKHQAPEGAKTYTINGATYYVDNEMVALTATNERRSRLYLTKLVTGEDIPDDAIFPFTITVNNSLAPSSEPDDDPNHESDYWVWFSVRDKDNNAVTEGISGATHDSGSWWYTSSGSPISILVKVGYSIMINNLPTGTTYTIVEGTCPTGFVYDKTELEIDGNGTDSTFSGDLTTTGTIESTNTEYYVTYNNKYELIDINVIKVWDDNDDQDGLRPKNLSLTLNGAPEDATIPDPEITISSDGNTWTYVWKALPRYDNNGNEIVYVITENSIPEGYNCEEPTANDGGTITNKHTPEVIALTVVKAWDDNDDQDGKRPESIVITLSDGQTVTLSEDNDWTATIKDLPKYADGEEIEYSWSENNVPEGYTMTGTKVEGLTTTTITNQHIPEETDIIVTKVWDDDDDANGARPKSVTIRLIVNDKEIESIELSDANGWTYTFEDYAVFENGKEVEYIITEDEVNLYKSNIEENEIGFVVTNTYNAPTGDEEEEEQEQDEEDTTNPHTADHISTYIRTLFMSLITLINCAYFILKNN